MLPSPPLGTRRASFPASGSSLSNALCGGRSAATYDCGCTCTFIFANEARGGRNRDTQARASSFVGCFKFSTNSCSLHHRQSFRAERPRGSQRGCPCRDLVLSQNATAIRLITSRPSLAPRSHTRPPLSLPCGRLSALRDEGSDGRGRAYHVPRQPQGPLGSALTPVVERPRKRKV